MKVTTMKVDLGVWARGGRGSGLQPETMKVRIGVWARVKKVCGDFASKKL